jgi:hypothetical protein
VGIHSSYSEAIQGQYYEVGAAHIHRNDLS